jgi:acetoin utilization deacetylase AcuC-like enzyme
VKAYCTDRFILPLPPGHRFPMEKYALLRERVLAEAIVSPLDLIEPPAARDEQLERAHDAGYVHRVTHGTLDPVEVRRIGFPWSPALVERSRRSVGATMAACRSALEEGVAVSLAGGTHHASRDRGEGFCVFNDAAVAVRVLQAEGRVTRALIVDLDVHQGNGTAAIFAGDTDVYTLDVHAANNFPFSKVPSDRDVALPDGTGDAEYLGAVEAAVPLALDSSRPDLVIYVAGADPYMGDRLGRLAVTAAGLARRDEYVLDVCRHHGLPVAVVMAGGYGKDIHDTVAIHAATVRAAVGRWRSGCGAELEYGAVEGVAVAHQDDRVAGLESEVRVGRVDRDTVTDCRDHDRSGLPA